MVKKENLEKLISNYEFIDIVIVLSVTDSYSMDIL